MEAHVASRVQNKLQRLTVLVAPRVAAACFSTLWNRWTTARRFQKRHRLGNHCVLGCEGGAEDSIEHYSCCQSVRCVGIKSLRLWPDSDRCTFMLTDPRIDDEETLTCVAVLVCATYMATNCFRQCGGTDAVTAKEALEQYCRQAVRGHLRSQRVTDSRWTQNPKSRTAGLRERERSTGRWSGRPTVGALMRA